MPSSGSLNLALRCAPLQCTENTRNCINRMFSPVVRREIEACVEPVLEASLLGYKNRCCASDMLDCWFADMLNFLFCGLFRYISSTWVFFSICHRRAWKTPLSASSYPSEFLCWSSWRVNECQVLQFMQLTDLVEQCMIHWIFFHPSTHTYCRPGNKKPYLHI